MLKTLQTLFLVALLVPSPALAQTMAFRHNAKRLPVGTVLQYTKSNLDGTNASNIDVYVRDKKEVESFKAWHEPATRATLVRAQMDWERFSVSGFQVFDLNCGQPPQARASLEVRPQEFRVSFLDQPIPLTHALWHSYDFDFTSLSLAMTMLRNPKSSFEIWRSDAVFEPMGFAEMGAVTLAYQASEEHLGRATRRYSIGGPGLRDTTGTWWADAKTGTLVAYEIPIPDEPGYKDVRFELRNVVRMNAREWEAHKQTTLCKASPAPR